jgi:hypothetical protein
VRALLAATSLVIVVGQPAADWLSAAMYDGLVQQLAERLEQIDLDWSLERRRNAAATVVNRLRARLAQMTHEDVHRRAPALASLKLPAVEDPRFEAIVRYQMYNAADFVAYERRAREPSEDARIAIVMRLTALTTTVLYLREGYMRAGGTEQQLERFLADKAFEPIVERLQRDAQLLQEMQAECAPVIKVLLNP